MEQMTEEYNGTSWSEDGDISTGQDFYLHGYLEDKQQLLLAGGNTHPPSGHNRFFCHTMEVLGQLKVHLKNVRNQVEVWNRNSWHYNLVDKVTSKFWTTNVYNMMVQVGQLLMLYQLLEQSWRIWN